MNPAALQIPSTVTQPSKPFTWSYSRLKNFETCGKRHLHVDLLKDFKEDESEQLVWGNAVHSALSARIAKKEPLPAGMEGYEGWATRIDAMPGAPAVELKLALTRDFQDCGYFDKKVWFRGVVDVVVRNGVVAWAGDWKTGKILEDPPQLGLMAACLFAKYPELQAIKTNFVWLKDKAAGNDEIYRRETMAQFWAGLLPRVAAMERAWNAQTYAPAPGRLCRNWCPVRVCPHHGN